MSQAIAVLIALIALWTCASAQETITVTLPLTPELAETLGGEWLTKHRCEHLARAGQPLPEGMTASLNAEGEPVCRGTPSQKAMRDTAQFYGEVLFRSQGQKKQRSDAAKAANDATR